jgi:hypothetical protein
MIRPRHVSSFSLAMLHLLIGKDRTVPRRVRAMAKEVPNQHGGRRGIGRWERRLTSIDRWCFIVDLLPRGARTDGLQYRALHREARHLAEAGLIQMVTLPRGPKRAAVGPIGLPFDL